MTFDFFKACQYGRQDLVIFFLLDPRIDPTTQDNQPTKEALVNGHSQTVIALLADQRIQQTADFSALLGNQPTFLNISAQNLSGPSLLRCSFSHASPPLP